MPLMTTAHCFRGRTDCESFDVIEAAPADTSDEQFETLDFTPVSFVCCGCVKAQHRRVPQDAYRLCFKTAASDEMSDNDEQDLTHLQRVIGTALAVLNTRRVAGGRIQAPTALYEQLAEVETKQK